MDTLVANCRVLDVGTDEIRCTHDATLERRTATTVEESEFSEIEPETVSLDALDEQVRQIEAEHSGVERKWLWGRLFRVARVEHGLTQAEIAASTDVSGTSSMQVQRSELVYEMFPDRAFEEHDISFSAIAELQRLSTEPEDVRALYDCIVASGVSLSTMETRAWVELLLAKRAVTRETVQQSVVAHVRDGADGLTDRVRRILAVHDVYHSRYC